jgi:hypothetical protein
VYLATASSASVPFEGKADDVPCHDPARHVEVFDATRWGGRIDDGTCTALMTLRASLPTAARVTGGSVYTNALRLDLPSTRAEPVDAGVDATERLLYVE